MGQKETLLYILYIKRDDDGIESTRTIGRETLRDQQRRETIIRPFAAIAASDLAPVLGQDENSAFLKWSSPETQNFTHRGILAQDECKVTTLPSGLRVATEATPYSETATIGVWIDAGSRYSPRRRTAPRTSWNTWRLKAPRNERRRLWNR